MKTIYMVEDEALLRDLFVEYVQLIPDLEFIGACGDGRQAIKEVLELRPDLLILDIRLPEVNGLEILLLLRRKLKDTRILVFSGSIEVRNVKMALDCKADGFVEKAYGLEELKKAIETVLTGKAYFSPGADKIRRSLQGNA
jgi:DNA-binding NarL/FixJ family response regulator